MKLNNHKSEEEITEKIKNKNIINSKFLVIVLLKLKILGLKVKSDVSIPLIEIQKI